MPVFTRIDEAGGHRIVLDVSLNPVELAGVPNQTIERFVAPEGFTGQTEKLVRGASGGTFKPAGESGKRLQRRDQHMNVVGHKNPGVKFIELPLVRPIQYGFGNDSRNAGVRKPVRALAVAIESLISFSESTARGQQQLAMANSQTPVQPPVEENRNAFSMDVRKSSSVFKHEGRRKRLPHTSAEASMLFSAVAGRFFSLL